MKLAAQTDIKKEEAPARSGRRHVPTPYPREVESSDRADPVVDREDDEAGKPRLKFVWRDSLRQARNLVERRSRKFFVVMVIAAVLLGGFVGWLAWYKVQQNASEESRAAAVAVAKKNVPTALSYDYRTIQNDTKNTQDVLTTEFGKQYESLMKNVVIDASKKRHAVTNAQVADTSVVSADPEDVKLLVFLNQTTEGDGIQRPQLNGSRVEVEMRNQSGKWLISSLKPR